MIDFHDPAETAGAVADRRRPLLIGLDVDGVLAPIVGHAHDAVLLGGMHEAVRRVAHLAEVHVAIVSGRSLTDLERFGFGPEVDVIGSHGMESRDCAMPPLTDDEQVVLRSLEDATSEAAARAGDGAWVEHKPASVVLHVRQADEAAGRVALTELADAVREVAGATTKAGSGVLEVFARHADKGTALVELALGLGVATTVFVGDDVTDEDAFARLGPNDVTIKVGDADTTASYRLRDPDAVLAWLQALPTTFA